MSNNSSNCEFCNDETQKKLNNCFRCMDAWLVPKTRIDRVAECPQHRNIGNNAVKSNFPILCKECAEDHYVQLENGTNRYDPKYVIKKISKQVDYD